jgi:ribosomal protein L16 Arg81 hydroxylase
MPAKVGTHAQRTMTERVPTFDSLPNLLMVTTLDELIHPVTCADFFETFWGKRFGYFGGVAGRFRELFPWEQLNTILEQQRFTAPRLRLVRRGQIITESSYFHSAGWPELSVGKMLNELENGATLSLSFVEETYSPLRDLAVSLEAIFRVRIHVNLYASWRTANGFGVHYDDHDVLALQVCGAKQWRIWPPTEANPLTSGVLADAGSIGQPVWDETLRDGSLLYVPRGSWHVAHALDEPSLHLTIAIKSKSAVDLVHWIADRLSNSSLVRGDLPHLDTTQTQMAYVSQLREELCRELDDDVIERYLQWLEGAEPARPTFTLPETVVPLAHAEDRLLKLIGARRLSFRSIANGKSECHINERRWTCPSCVVPGLLTLNDGKWHSIRSLTSTMGRLDAGILDAVITALIMSRDLLIMESP